MTCIHIYYIDASRVFL